jgi:hypothetical protein
MNASKMLTTLRKQNTVFVKDVNIPTYCIGSRNTSFREGWRLNYDEHKVMTVQLNSCTLV